MNKDWNYALMWDTTRRALEESANQGLEVTALNVLNGMIMLEELEERRRKEREERKAEIIPRMAKISGKNSDGSSRQNPGKADHVRRKN